MVIRSPLGFLFFAFIGFRRQPRAGFLFGPCLLPSFARGRRCPRCVSPYFFPPHPPAKVDSPRQFCFFSSFALPLVAERILIRTQSAPLGAFSLALYRSGPGQDLPVYSLGGIEGRQIVFGKAFRRGKPGFHFRSGSGL